MPHFGSTDAAFLAYSGKNILGIFFARILKHSAALIAGAFGRKDICKFFRTDF